MDLDDVFLDEPRPRRLWPVVAVVVPVSMFAGFATWFIRAYVAPPMVTISDDAIAAPVAQAQPPEAAAPETTGASIPANKPEPAPIFTTLAFAPIAVPPAPTRIEPTARTETIDVTMLDATDPALHNSEPISGAVPLPRPRPHLPATTTSALAPRPRP